MSDLGLNLHVLILKVAAVLPLEEMKEVLKGIVAVAGMRTGGMEAAAWTYPIDQFGTGGIGNTIIQPLVESFLVSDDWHTHGHTFIVLASCRPYSTRAITSYVRKNLGPVSAKRVVNI
jgi:hypothetical protein